MPIHYDTFKDGQNKKAHHVFAMNNYWRWVFLVQNHQLWSEVINYLYHNINLKYFTVNNSHNFYDWFNLWYIPIFNQSADSFHGINILSLLCPLLKWSITQPHHTSYRHVIKVLHQKLSNIFYLQISSSQLFSKVHKKEFLNRTCMPEDTSILNNIW